MKHSSILMSDIIDYKTIINSIPVNSFQGEVM